MRVTINVDSATPQEVYDLTMAFQRTNDGMPSQIGVRPEVTVQGKAMGWMTPALYPDHAQRLIEEYQRITNSTDVHSVNTTEGQAR